MHTSNSAPAMATEAPDPRTFQSWEDAFQYPIPIVRKLEQQLRNNADENREKLRSLVGYEDTPLYKLHNADTAAERATATSSPQPKQSSTWKCRCSRSKPSSQASARAAIPGA